MFLSKEYYWLCVFPCFLIWAKSAMNECMPPWMVPWRKKTEPVSKHSNNFYKEIGWGPFEIYQSVSRVLGLRQQLPPKKPLLSPWVPLDHWYPLKRSLRTDVYLKKISSECLQCLKILNTFSLVLHFPINAPVSGIPRYQISSKSQGSIYI